MSKKTTQFVLTIIFMVLAVWAIFAWFSWQLLVVLFLWTTFSRLEAKL